jgi:hypothetical protein
VGRVRAVTVALLAAVAGAVVALPEVAAANDAGSITHGAGATTAELRWDAAEFGVAKPQLTITRAGVPFAIKLDDVCDVGCVLLADDPKGKPQDSILQVADVDADGEPEVLVDVYTGGAHCCQLIRVLTWTGAGYRTRDVFGGDAGYTLRDADGDGRPELVGYDPRFSGAFTAFAASGFPAQVLQITAGEVADVTVRFRALVRRDAKEWRKELRKAERRRYDVRGLLAAYVADEYRLGAAATARRELDRQLRAHRITRAFRSLLLRRLKAWGYR